MNTRSFLKSLAIACVAPQILIPKLTDHCRWQVGRSTMWGLSVVAPNPAWESAPYELVAEGYTIWVHRRDSITDRLIRGCPPMRFVLNKSGVFEHVPEFVQKSSCIL